MKHITLRMLGLFFLSAIAFSSCTKVCEPKNPKCKEKVPTGIVCQAYFESWIYDHQTKQCKLTGYSACSPVGFATEQECSPCGGTGGLE